MLKNFSTHFYPHDSHNGVRLTSSMAVRILARTAQMVLVVFGVVTLIFFVLRLAAGDPARLMNPPGHPSRS